MVSALIDSNVPQLKLLSKGKVRDIYATSSPEHLLFVASDRISAYDVILKNGIPDKGRVLTELSLFWFAKLKYIIPNHVVTSRIEEMPKEVHQHKEQLEGRSILVKKAEVIPLEAIVRGYITGKRIVLGPGFTREFPIISGSAWAEYKKSRTVHGIPLPDGLLESEKFPVPLFTPSTKAEQGAHDENISPEQAAALIGQELYDKISAAAVRLYTAAAENAATRGLIVADTKFEFGLVDGELILIDEALTPDSSRYWPLEGYAPGRSQPSFDKQYLRDWLTSQGFRKGLEGGPDGEGWTMSEEVVRETRERYLSARDLLLSDQ
ncbi:phosphoribosylaminoimidazole-succinocarboxamide synthase [Lactarius akahatsu]|uniref:Phosphoribosylaminoimidazole-succinocarboxamide synthase n=1 Tax=Lactarius akahatsu TaxID=416441 RepID=A0AAD4LA03_9AGAM|nr:phosphoribosylaminoimidazole-succinocarboxamide synthase [Lactarius akahatsu]